MNPPDGAPTDPQAAAARAKHTDKHINFAAATGAVALATLYARAPETAAKIILPVTGFDLRKPGAAKVTPLAALWLLPQPFGIVPPGWYGLPPNYVGKVAPFLPESAYLQTVAPDHPSVAEHYRKLEQQRALNVTKFGREGHITSTAAETVKGLDIGGKAEFIKRNAQDLANWFGHQLTGPHIGTGVGEVAFSTLLSLAAAEPPAADVIDPKYVSVVVALGSLVMQALQAANRFDP